MIFFLNLLHIFYNAKRHKPTKFQAETYLVEFLFPATPSASPRQGTWLTRLDPRPQIDGNLHWVPVQRVLVQIVSCMLLV